MANRKKNVFDNFGDIVTSNMGNVSKKYRDKAPNDKSFFTTICGVNRKFTDDVPSEEQSKIIERYSIPETIENNELNFYTVKLNEGYYTTKQVGSFKLYDHVMAYLPNADFSRFYLDYPVIGEQEKKVTIPQTIVSETEPEGEFNEGDWWDKIDSNGNILAVYCYLPNEETGELEWQLQYSVLTGTGGVGEFTDELHLNERFNDYSGNIIASGNWQHNEGHSNVISGGDANHVEGYNNKAVNTCNYVHIQGSDNVADGCSNVDIGGAYNTMTNGFCFSTIVRGERNVIQGASRSAVFGSGNMAISCDKYLICGERNTAQYGNSSILGGYNNTLTSSDYSLVCGSDNQGTAYASAVFGVGNSFSNVNYALIFGVYGTADSSKRLVIGGGQSSARANIFEVTTSGAVYATGGYNAMGADYAEYFEWSDGNPDNEDRRGLLVTLDGDKIALANGDDILGIVSAAPSVTGNSAALGWHGRYKTDIFGAPIRDDEGKPILSDDYDKDMKYIPRSERPEWAAIGLVGRLIVCDNGKCFVNGYVSAHSGIAVPVNTKTNIRVLKRIDDTHVEVLIK